VSPLRIHCEGNREESPMRWVTWGMSLEGGPVVTLSGSPEGVPWRECLNGAPCRASSEGDHLRVVPLGGSLQGVIWWVPVGWFPGRGPLQGIP
jgi:hypothetical protein